MAFQTNILKVSLVIILAMILLQSTVPQLIRPGECDESCGDLKIPYPFGTKKGCFLKNDFNIRNDFNITCNHTSIPPKPLWNNYEVINISTDDAQIRIFTDVAKACYTPNGTKISERPGSFSLVTLTTISSFPFSHSRNRFYGVGCQVSSRLLSSGQLSGCMSSCFSIHSVIDGICSGAGCCETSIPDEPTLFEVYVLSEDVNHTVSDFNPCSFSFVAADDFYKFSTADLKSTNLRGKNVVPSILDWSVGNQTCEEAQKDSTKYVCGNNSLCTDSNNGPGYICHCSPGYRGNPYLENGCQDVDECLEFSHKCVNNSNCVNNVGTYRCSCHKGYQGDGKTDGIGCPDIDECLDPGLNDCKGQHLCINTPGGYSCSSHNSSTINVAVGVGVSMVVVIVASSLLFWGIRKRKYIKLKQKFFEQNGGILLQQIVEQKELTSNMLKIFTSEELKAATKNYDVNQIAGRGGYATVYKGTLPDGSLVAIKKPKKTDIEVDKEEVNQFISEVVVLCQVNNRNIVRILGCCLETQSPLLVYEFVSNGTLSEHLHDKEGKSKGTLSWETRLKIATQTAEVLSYLHTQAVTPIIHRDIKSTNILLDNNFNPKVSDFGASKLVAYDEMEVYTVVQGTMGYWDPEYFQTSQLTEKSDVYSFGVVLVELLTGQKAFCSNKPEAEKNLANYFLSFLRGRRLVEVLEPRVVEEGSLELLQEVANIARRCLSLKGDERPNMKEVAMELERLRSINQQVVMTIHVDE